MDKRNQILIGILLFQVALVAGVFWPRSVTQAGGTPLLGSLDPAQVTGVTLTDGAGNRTALTREGESWLLSEADAFPADGIKVGILLDKLGRVATGRLITQTEASHRRLKVAADDFQNAVDLTMADGSSQRLYIGSAAGPGTLHVRAADRPEVYLTGELTAVDIGAAPSGWIDALYISLPPTATVGLTLESAGGTFTFEKEGESWTMAGLSDEETLNESAVASLVSTLSALRMERPLGKSEQPEYGLAEPLATITLRTSEGATQTLLIGAADAAGSYAAKWSESPYFVRLPAGTGALFVEKERADFLEAPAPPEP